MPKIYISAMETHVPREQIFDKRANQLLELLKQTGFELYWEKEWRDYERIKQEIASCDALLAIVDKTWQSSTWMASEVTWANGQEEAIHRSKQRIKPPPIFLYPILEREKWGWLAGIEGPIVLDRDVHKAIARIIGVLLN